MESTSILEKVSSVLDGREVRLSDSMKRPKEEPAEPQRETFRDYLRRVMAEDEITDRKIEEATEKLPTKISKSWVNLILSKGLGVKGPGIKMLDSLAKALNRSRTEVIAAYLEEPLGEATQLIANIDTAYQKLKSDEDREFYKRVLEELGRSMRRAGR